MCLIGVYDENVICKIANNMPKISIHVWCSLETRVCSDENLNQLYCNGVMCVCLCFCCSECFTMIFYTTVPWGHKYCGQILSRHNFSDWNDKKKKILWHKSLLFRTLPCILRRKAFLAGALLTPQKYCWSIVN